MAFNRNLLAVAFIALFFVLTACAPVPTGEVMPDEEEDQEIIEIDSSESEEVSEPEEPETDTAGGDSGMEDATSGEELIKVINETLKRAFTPRDNTPPKAPSPEPVFYFSMDVDPSDSDPLIEKRKGVWLDRDGGKVDGAWAFDGRDDFIIASFDSLKAFDDFTIIFWMNPADLKRRGHMLWQGDEDIPNDGKNAGNGWGPEAEIHVSLGDVLAGNEIYGLERNKLTFYLGDPAKNIEINTDIYNIDWQHIAVVVRDANSNPSAEMILDGVSVGKDSMTGKIGRSPWGNLRLGTAAKYGPAGDSNRDYDGFLDELEIYDFAMTYDEVLETCKKNNKDKCNGLS